MNLPFLEKAVVDQNKITDYLLASDHPEGGSKAAFFYRFGFAPAQWETLANALVEHARSNPVCAVFESKYGVKYQIEGPISCPDGRSPLIRSIWIIDAGNDFPRLVTAYPLE